MLFRQRIDLFSSRASVRPLFCLPHHSPFSWKPHLLSLQGTALFSLPHHVWELGVDTHVTWTPWSVHLAHSGPVIHCENCQESLQGKDCSSPEGKQGNYKLPSPLPFQRSYCTIKREQTWRRLTLWALFIPETNGVLIFTEICLCSWILILT